MLRADCWMDYGFDKEALETIVQTGKPYQASGCPGRQDDVSACNRPYGDSMPADIRSFPFALNTADIEKVQRQMRGRTFLLMGNERAQ